MLGIIHPLVRTAKWLLDDSQLTDGENRAEIEATIAQVLNQ